MTLSLSLSLFLSLSPSLSRSHFVSSPKPFWLGCCRVTQARSFWFPGGYGQFPLYDSSTSGLRPWRFLKLDSVSLRYARLYNIRFRFQFETLGALSYFILGPNMIPSSAQKTCVHTYVWTNTYVNNRSRPDELRTHMYVYIYIYMYIHICIYIYVCIERET